MRIPKYRKHSSGGAFVEHSGKRIYLPGRYKSDESKEAYRQFLLQVGLQLKAPPVPGSLGNAPSVSRVVLSYLEYAKTLYGEERNTEYGKMRVVGDKVISMFPSLPAAEFTPKKLKAFRESLLAEECFETVNAKVGRLRRMFAWAVEEELISGSIHHALMAVKGVTRNYPGVKRQKKRKPVAESDVLATIPELNSQVADMVRFQWLVGARSSSICRARPEQFDRSESIWLWRPRHKMEWLDHELVLPIGPQAQAIILPYLTRAEKRTDRAGRYLFDPSRQRRNRRYGKRYTSQSYRQAVRRAIDRVNASRADQRAAMETDEERKALPNLAQWSPHQIRHARGKAVRAKHGLEGSKAALGHETLAMAELYAERDLELAKRIATEMG